MLKVAGYAVNKLTVSKNHFLAISSIIPSLKEFVIKQYLTRTVTQVPIAKLNIEQQYQKRNINNRSSFQSQK